ncbi:MAG: sodium-dependent dicarboxylate transporter 2/3/5, partial [Myxococcota bacterium]
VTEAIPIPATSMVPLLLLPTLGIAPVGQVAPTYASPFIILLMGGFFIALTLEKWNLHRRIALGVIARVGSSPGRLVLGFMIAGAALSMWISNTATALMMLPIAVAVLQRTEERVGKGPGVRAFGVALMLGIAYACNIGGLGTPIGTPPNLIMISQYEKMFPNAEEITFVSWALTALPIVVIMLGAIWFILTRVTNRIPKDLDIGDASTIAAEAKALGSLTVPERRVLIIFGLTALFWITRKPIAIAGLSIGGWSPLLGLNGRVDDGTVAIGAALLMFLIPAGGSQKRDVRLLDWETAVKIPWGLLLLFGGGLALASGFKSTGLSVWVGERMASVTDLPPVLMIGIICLGVTFLTEVTSNTATTTILMPILASVCKTTGVDPMSLMLPAAMSASCAFMLPVATAPNAIVFGSGRIEMGDMVKNGFVINLIGVVVITAVLVLF